MLGIVQREQHLRHVDLDLGERALVGVGQLDLPAGGGGLALVQPQAALGQPEPATPQRDGALAAQGAHVAHDAFEPACTQSAAALVHQQRGTDLDHDPPGGAQRVIGRDLDI